MNAFLAADFSIATALVTAGFLYMLVSVVAWLMLRNQGAGAPTIWCLGGMSMGMGVMLVGLRTTVGPWVSFLLGNSLIVVGNLMHVMALSKELHRPMGWPTFVGTYLVVLVPFSYLHLVLQNPTWRFTWNLICLGLLTSWTAWNAGTIGRREKSQSAFWLAVFYGLLSLEILSRGVMTGIGWSHTTILDSSLENLRMVVSVLMSGVLGNIMVIGLYLERAGKKNIQFAVDTERQQINSRLGDKITALYRERSMDQVSITLAHELGQPITGLLLDINMVRLHCQKLGMADTETDGFINSLEKHALRAREIIGAIRGFVKSETVVFEPVDVCTVVRDVMALFNNAVRENHVHFDAQFARPQAWIHGHAVLLSLVFHNLFRNAIQASTVGTAAHVTVTMTEQEKQLEVLIEDRGPGFSHETLTQVGERGFTTKQDGMGVGLALCRRIIEQHRGTLTLGNRDNTQGARISLVFPYATPTTDPL